MVKKLRDTGFERTNRSLDQFIGSTLLIDAIELSMSPEYGRRATVYATPCDASTGEILGSRHRLISFGEGVLEVSGYLTQEANREGVLHEPVIVRVAKEGATIVLIDPTDEPAALAEPNHPASKPKMADKGAASKRRNSDIPDADAVKNPRGD